MCMLTTAANADTIPEGDKPLLARRTMEHSDAVLAIRNSVFLNPAMQATRYKTSLNDLAVGFCHHGATKAARLEQGSMQNTGTASAQAYLHKGKGTIYGGASYDNGTAKDIRYCESSDFGIVAPYVMADTVGGATHRERYRFSGGFSWPAGRFLIGAEGEYRALMEYRTRDPRPKNLSGDLRVKVGTAYTFATDHMFGVALTARKYKQTNEVEIYNEVSMPTIYHLTGLGNDYYRFRGDYSDTYYKGYGLGGMITFAHASNRGLFATAGYEYTNIEKIISSLNQLPLNRLITHAANAAAGYTMTCGEGNTVAVSVSGGSSRKTGTENIFGTAQDNIYPKISEAEQYRLTLWNAALQAAWRAERKNHDISAAFSLSIDGHEERYFSPRRTLNSHALSPSICLATHAITGRFLLTGGVSACYAWSFGNTLSLPKGTEQSSLATPTLHYYEYLSHGRTQTRLTIEAAYEAERFMPYVSAGWQYAHYARSEHANGIEVALGVRF